LYPERWKYATFFLVKISEIDSPKAISKHSSLKNTKTIAKSAVVPVATWLRHPLRLDALSRIAARASHGG